MASPWPTCVVVDSETRELGSQGPAQHCSARRRGGCSGPEVRASAQIRARCPARDGTGEGPVAVLSMPATHPPPHSSLFPRIYPAVLCPGCRPNAGGHFTGTVGCRGALGCCGQSQHERLTSLHGSLTMLAGLCSPRGRCQPAARGGSPPGASGQPCVFPHRGCGLRLLLGSRLDRKAPRSAGAPAGHP